MTNETITDTRSRFIGRHESPDCPMTERAGLRVQSPVLTGLHHVRLPVSDVLASRDWYVEVLGFETRLDEEEETGVVGAVLAHDSGLVLGLHLDKERAASLAGFVPLALTVASAASLGSWVAWCDHVGAAHGEITIGEVGVFVDLFDPDGILIRLHTAEQPSVDET